MRIRRIAALGLPLALGGCSAVGGAIGGLTGAFGSVLGLLISLAAVAAPIALSYWLYQREKD
jgi:hypothetical protein